MLQMLQQTGIKLVFISVSLGVCIVYGSYIAGIFDAATTPELLMDHQAEPEYQLAMDYAVGRGVDINKSKAIEWMIQSAEHGFSEAQFMLGNAYYQGVIDQTINQNHNKAYVWYSLAAMNGYTKASALRYEISANLSPAELMAAKQEIARISMKRIQH